jgi:hypothetical protein
VEQVSNLLALPSVIAKPAANLKFLEFHPYLFICSRIKKPPADASRHCG